jgi:hypothetical protein
MLNVFIFREVRYLNILIVRSNIRLSSLVGWGEHGYRLFAREFDSHQELRKCQIGILFSFNYTIIISYIKFKVDQI